VRGSCGWGGRCAYFCVRCYAIDTPKNMQNKIKPYLTELIWLTVSLALTMLLAAFLFGWTFLKGDLDIHLQDTYFVFSSWLILTPLFLLVTFVLYFIKERRKSFSRTLPNWLTIISGLTLVLTLTLLIKQLSEFASVLTGGWTAYPPLSTLKDPEPELTKNPLITIISNFFTVVQFIILTMVLYFAFRCGTQKKFDRRE